MDNLGKEEENFSFGKWEKKLLGLQREGRGPYGQNVNELYDPRLGTLRRRENFPDASRRTCQFGEAAQSSSEEIGKFIVQTTPTEVSFFDQNSRIEIIQNSGEITVKGGENRDWSLIDVESLFILSYKKGVLKSFDLQAEPYDFERREPEEGDLASNLKALLGYLKTDQEDAARVVSMAIADIARETREKETDKGNLEDSDVFVEALYLKLLEYSDSPQEAKDLLDKLNFKDAIFADLARGFVFDEKGGFLSPEELLNRIVKDQIESLRPLKIYQRLLKIEGLDDQKLSWSEVDIEEVEGGKETKKINSGVCEFGSDIPIQEHLFSVKKVGVTIIVTCTKLPNNQLWKVEFPVLIPQEKVSEIIDDSNADFRKIKDLIPVSLKISSERSITT